jgi:hypothetical protein
MNGPRGLALRGVGFFAQQSLQRFALLFPLAGKSAPHSEHFHCFSSESERGFNVRGLLFFRRTGRPHLPLQAFIFIHLLLCLLSGIFDAKILSNSSSATLISI